MDIEEIINGLKCNTDLGYGVIIECENYNEILQNAIEELQKLIH